MILELMGNASTMLATRHNVVELEARMSPRNVAIAKASAPGTMPYVPSIGRAASARAIAQIPKFYEQVLGCALVHNVTSADGLVRLCYAWSFADSDACYTFRPEDENGDDDDASSSDFSVEDFEDLLGDKGGQSVWWDNHYCVDDSGDGTGEFNGDSIVEYLNAHPGEINIGCEGSMLHYIEDPTGFSIQTMLQFTISPTDCETQIAGAMRTTTLEDVLYDDDGEKVLYAYFRQDNFHSAETVSTMTDVPARAVTWNYTFRIFDSLHDVHVWRYDIFSDGTPTTLGDPSESFLAFPNAYIFTSSPSVTLTDAVTGTNVSIEADSVAWINSGACVRVTADPTASFVSSANGNVSIMVVTAGAFNATTFSSPSSSCKALESLVGHELHDNVVEYVSNGTCQKPLAGPTDVDYDNLDGQIGPLESHYHTRGSLYYNVEGSSTYDVGVSPLQAGELRFVNEGYFYGKYLEAI